jgi:digeranylgeranylglycerophospholipid reductase
MRDVQEAVIVGGGPAGSSSAFELAKRGIQVSVLEEHKEIGFPSHCAGHLSIRGLRALGLYPLPKGIVENTFSSANFYSPNGYKLGVHLTKPVTCAINRALFDKYLAEKAETAGARYFLDSRVQSLIISNGFVNGISVSEAGTSQAQSISAKLVVDAEGVSSRLMRQSRLQPFDGNKLVYAVEAEVESVRDVEEHTVEVYLGKRYANGLYGWLIPLRNGSAKVGLAVRKGNPREFLERLIRKHPVASKQLRSAKLRSMVFHAIPLGGPIRKAFANGFLALGDCASQVKPTTGGGVVFGITCARIAGEVGAEAIRKHALSEAFLGSYQKRVNGLLGFDSKVMLKARQIFDRLSDERIDSAMRFADQAGLGNALRNVEEIDFQGRTLLTVAKKPAALATLAYVAALYFFGPPQTNQGNDS